MIAYPTRTYRADGSDYTLVDLGCVSAQALVAYAKLNARVDWAVEDSLFLAWCTAAAELAEGYTGRRFTSRGFRVEYRDWPVDDSCWGYLIRLPVEPVSAVTSVQYYATDGVLTTLDSSLYQTQLAHSPPLIAPAPLTVWPVVQSERLNGVQVTFTAGYATRAPKMFEQAVLMTVRYWAQEGRDAKDATKGGLPPGATRLLDLLDTGGYPT